MTVDAAELFFTILAFVAVAGAAAIGLLFLAARFSPGAADTLDAVRAQVGPSALGLAFLVAATCMGGSLYFSEVEHFRPCTLCWYQRIAMYPQAVILGVAALRRDVAVRWYVLPLCGIGACISAYHYLVERYPSLEAGSCDATTPCSVPWFEQFGFVTLSFMAFCGFAAIAALVFLPRAHDLDGRSYDDDDEADVGSALVTRSGR